MSYAAPDVLAVLIVGEGADALSAWMKVERLVGAAVYVALQHVKIIFLPL